MRKRKRPIVPEALSITPFPSVQLFGFDPTLYTVIEGVNAFVRLRIFRTGQIGLPGNVTFATVPGSAEGNSRHHVQLHEY